MVKRINQELLTDIVDSLNGKRLTGYQIFAVLEGKYHRLSRRLVYHYLSLALKRGDVKVETVIEEGKFSWGNSSKKRYYTRA